MSDFMNWQQFAAANPGGPDEVAETQRQGLQKALDSLGTEAVQGARMGGSQNLSDYGSFKQVQQQGQQAMQRFAAHKSDTWDRLTNPQASAPEIDPWNELSRQLGDTQRAASGAYGQYQSAKEDRAQQRQASTQYANNQAASKKPLDARTAYSNALASTGSYEQAYNAYVKAGGQQAGRQWTQAQTPTGLGYDGATSGPTTANGHERQMQPWEVFQRQISHTDNWSPGGN